MFQDIASGWAAILGALVGALGGVAGTWLVVRHELKTRWDSDRRSAYLDFLDVAGRLQAGISDMQSVGDRASPEHGVHLDQLDALSDRLLGIEMKLALFASDEVIESARRAVGTVRDYLVAVTDSFDERPVEDPGKGLSRESDDAISEFARACRGELKIPKPKTKSLRI